MKAQWNRTVCISLRFYANTEKVKQVQWYAAILMSKMLTENIYLGHCRTFHSVSLVTYELSLGSCTPHEDVYRLCLTNFFLLLVQ